MTIQEIAQQTGHSAADVEAMLNMMAANMIADGVVDMFHSSDMDTKRQFVRAYGTAAAKATFKAATAYSTNDEFRDAVNLSVLDQIKSNGAAA